MSDRLGGAGPLAGVKVIELAGIGPGPFGAMMLSDMGAEVVRVDRPDHVPAEPPAEPSKEVLGRGRRSVAIDLKIAEGVELLLDLVERADVLVEPFRPRVAERLGIGPETCLARNPRLVYARMTGWGQDGPYAQLAGHDINYVALTGALHAVGRRSEPPPPPLNLVADFGGGGMLLAFGIVSALLERSRSGRGQVVDAAMVDGVAALLASVLQLAALGLWTPEREANILDGGAHFYATYRTSDDRFVSVGALEPKFYAELLERLRLDPTEWPQEDPSRWPQLKERLADIFASRTRAEWCDVFEGADACFAPVLTYEEAPEHPHLSLRGSFVTELSVTQPAPAPRFTRTPGAIQGPPPWPGEHTCAVLADWGIAATRIDDLLRSDTIRETSFDPS